MTMASCRLARIRTRWERLAGSGEVHVAGPARLDFALPAGDASDGVLRSVITALAAGSRSRPISAYRLYVTDPATGVEDPEPFVARNLTEIRAAAEALAARPSLDGYDDDELSAELAWRRRQREERWVQEG